MFDVFVDKKFADKLAKEDRSFAKKLSSHIGNIISEMKRAIAAFAAGKDKIEIKALYNDIEKLDKIRDMLLEGLDKASENFKAREQEQKNTAGEAVDNKYSIKDIVDDNGKEYNNAVVLDTNIFDGVKPRNWSKILTKHLVNNFAGKRFTVYDENGLEKTIEFAREKDRVKKDGANRSHIVLDKLSRKSDINSQLAVAHADEIIQVMKLENETKEHSHQWLDENGWNLYKAILMQKNNKIFEATINVAKARDGRNILYDINKIKEIGHGDVSSKSPKAQRDSHINPDFYEPILSQKDTSVNTNSIKIIQDDAQKKIESRKDVEDSVQSQEFKNWFGDWQNDSESASKVVNFDGTPKIMYHGSPNSFTAFDKKKAKASGLYGKGFYFTDSESHAGQYGDKYAVYLNIKNPLEPGGFAMPGIAVTKAKMGHSRFED